jgi:beta-ribofuranosylaminobenzene 5'-phosphate synthase
MIAPPSDVSITAHARLHLGFLDLEGGLGRRYGGLGLGLEAPATRLVVTRADALVVEGVEAERARAHLNALCEAHGRQPRFRLTVETTIPAHAGLGSGTQLALAVGRAFALMEGLPLTAAGIASTLSRGARSGIGIGTFDHGGLVLDGGRGAGTAVPPVLARLPFPDDWRVLLIFDPATRGVHGPEERRAFQTLPPFPASTAAHLCRLVVMQALPAVAEADLPAFGGAIEEIQAVMGRHFAPAQGGSPYTSGKVAAVLAWLQVRGVRCVGQSSWGPTGFAFFPNELAARDVMEALQRTGLTGTLTLAIEKARNRGADIFVKPPG